ncbi:hypothetical protein IJI94_02875 [Candidatus Saccharibacteria bacterium]|nr:hypothetical protein [Candidatus Saccharibacteria bacterium]
MIRDPFLEDMESDVFPPSDKEIHGTKYTSLTLLHKQGKVEGPSEQEMNALAGLIVDLHPDIKPETLTKIKKKIKSNKGLYQFFLDYGVYSDFFIPWLLQIPTAMSLEVAFGYGYDISGKWRKIPKDDAFYWWVIREGMFIYLRERAVNTARLIQDKDNVLILGAGYLPELRYVDYEPTTKNLQTIVAVDSNADIPKSKLFEKVSSIEDIYLDYRTGNLMEILQKSRDGLFDAIVMNGVMSYCYDHMLDIIWMAIDKLKPSGVFMFDLQLKEWNIVRDALVFDWKTNPPMKLIDDVKKTIEIVLMRCRNLPVQVSHSIDSNHQSVTFKIIRFK